MTYKEEILKLYNCSDTDEEYKTCIIDLNAKLALCDSEDLERMKHNFKSVINVLRMHCYDEDLFIKLEDIVCKHKVSMDIDNTLEFLLHCRSKYADILDEEVKRKKAEYKEKKSLISTSTYKGHMSYIEKLNNGKKH